MELQTAKFIKHYLLARVEQRENRHGDKPLPSDELD